MPSLTETPEYRTAQRFAELTVEKQALKERLDEIVAQLKAIEPALVGYLTSLGMQQFAVRGYLLYQQREPMIYPARGISRQQVCEALKMSSLGYMVKENYSTQSLSAYVKRQEEGHQGQLIAGLDEGALGKLLPPALAGILDLKNNFHIRVKEKEAPGPWREGREPPPQPEPELEQGDEEL